MANGVIVSALLSIFGSLVIISSGFLLKRYHNRKNRLVMILSLTDLTSCIGFLISAATYIHTGAGSLSGTCTFVGILIEFSESAAVMWSLCICVYVFTRVVFEKKIPRMELIFHVLAWGVPIGFTLGALGIQNAYGAAGVWCWIIGKPAYARYLFLYDIVIGTMLTILICYIIIGIRVRKSMSFSASKLKQRAIFKLAAYPVCFSNVSISIEC
jgi:hypothetical protein